MALLVGGLFLCLLVRFGGAIEADTQYGRVLGVTLDLGGKEIAAFTGIPYARPPVGENRFKRPEEPDPWSGVLNTTTQPSACPQTTSDGNPIYLTHPHWENFNEDCLFLSIFAPTPLLGQSLAVMVNFHGGANRNSANIMYPGHFYARRDIVMVSVNYRIGCLGWATSGDGTSTGNYGLFDQQMALRFVRDNIANFGGDPNRVTIFGYSAGGSSVGLHLVSPGSADLFHQAIPMSGTDQSPWSFNPSWLPPENYTRDVADYMNCTYSTPGEMIACLRTKDAMTIANYREAPISGWISIGFGPVVDGPDGFLPDDPYQLRYERRFKRDVRVMAGYTSEDGATYLLPFVPEAIDGGWNRSMHEYYFRERLVGWAFARDPPEIQEDLTRAFQWFYTDWPQDENTTLNRAKAVEAVTDAGFGFGVDLVMMNHTEFNTTYEYLMGYRADAFDDIRPKWWGAFHSSDVPFWFGFPHFADFPAAQDHAELWAMGEFNWTAADKEYSDFCMTLFTNFAKTGNPTPSPVPGPDGKPPVTWEAFRADDRNYLFIGNDVIEGRKNLRSRNNAYWQRYLPYLLKEGSNPATQHVSGVDWNFSADFQINKNVIAKIKAMH